MKKLLMTLVLLPLMAFSAVETTADGYNWTFSREGKGVKITNVSPELSGSVTFPAKLGGLDVVNIVWDDWPEAEGEVENWDVEEIVIPAALADSLTNGLMNVARNDGRERRIGGCKETEASWGIVFGRFRALYRIDILGDSSRWAVIGESIYTKDHKTLVFHPAGNWSLTLSRDVCSVIDRIEVWLSSGLACVGCCDPDTRWVLFHSNLENVDDVYASDVASIVNASFGLDHGWWLSTGATEEPDWQQVSATHKVIGDYVEEVTKLVVNEDLPGCAFSGCQSVQEVFLGENVRTIGYDAFCGCSNLAVVNGGTGLVWIDGWAFRDTPFRDYVKDGPVMIGCSWIVDFKGTMPEAFVIPDGVRGFSFNCQGLRDLTLPSSFCMEGSFAFGGNLRVPTLAFWLKKRFSVYARSSACEPLNGDGYMLYVGGELMSTVDLPGSMRVIPDSLFESCKSLNSVSIGEGITEIGESAFSGCINLFTAELPSTLKKIGAFAFDGCLDLDLELPQYVDEIGEDAFYGTYAIEEAKETARKNKTVAYLGNWLIGWGGDSEDYDGPSSVAIRNGTRGVFSGAFAGCHGLKSVTFPSGLISIGANAFACTDVTLVKLPAGLKVIGAHAFGGSRLVAFPSLPGSLERVGNDVFKHDDWGESGVTPAYAKTAKGFVIKDGWLLGYKQYDYVLDPECGHYHSNEDSLVEKPETIVLPSSVKHIADRVFWDDWGDGSIESFDVPASVLTIGRDALSEVKNKVIFRGKPPKVDLDEEGDSPFYNAKVGCFIAGTAGWTAGEKFYGLPMEARIVSGGKLVEMRAVRVEVEGAGSVSGAGNFVVGKKVTLKATAKKGYVFAGWYRDEAGEEPVEGETDYRSPSYAYVVGEDDVTFYAKFISVDEDWVCVETSVCSEFLPGVPIDGEMLGVFVESTSLPTVTVKGLPSGLKFDAKTLTISGTPTKSGVYIATVTANSAGKKTATDTMRIVVRTENESIVDAEWETAKGKVTGMGVCAANKSLTLKATANMGYVFAGWYRSVAIPTCGDENCPWAYEDPVEGGVDFRNPSLAVQGDGTDALYFARFVRAEDDDELWANVEDAYSLNGPWSLKLDIESMSLPTVTVKGLPSGLKFDTKALTISGTPTKPGTYPITLTLKNKTITKARTQTFTLYVANIESPYLAGVDYANDAYVYRVGTSMEFDIGSCVTDGYSVTGVSGLPSGLKFDKNTGLITGVPTKAGPKTVTITLKNGKLTSSATITLNVDAIDAWAYGTFNGGGENGVLTLTVGSTGKISGKWMTVDGTWMLSAKSYESYDESEGSYSAVLDAKCGKDAAKFALTAYADGQMKLFAEDQQVATAWRNVWKDAYWMAIAAQMKSTALTLTDEVSLKVGASGAVTATGKFVTGQNAQRKDIIYSASCSTVLVPVLEDVFKLYLCFPKKSGKFDGMTLQEVLEWNGRELEIDCGCRPGF